jgi:hypothetical protein
VTPVLLPTGFLRPTPPALAGVACSICDRPQSRWELIPPTKQGEVVFLCSTCVLYASPFAKLPSLRQGLEPLVAQVEETIGRPLARDNQGRLIGSDADRIVFSIVLVSNSRPR